MNQKSSKFESFLYNILGNEFSVQDSNENFEKMVKNYSMERADGFVDLINVLDCFEVTNVTEIVRKYSRDRMLKLTAIQMRELLWNPNTRNDFL